MIDCSGINGASRSLARQQSIERFVKRFNRTIDDPEEINEKHIALRRLILLKLKQMSHILHDWRQASKETAMDEQRSEIVSRLVTKSMSTVAQIVEKAQITQLSAAFRELLKFKGQRIEIEYQKTIAIQMLSQKLGNLLNQRYQLAYRNITVNLFTS